MLTAKSLRTRPKYTEPKSKHDLFIEKCEAVHSKRFSYEKTLFTGYKNKVVITCRRHGDFTQTPGNHLNGSGCMQCYRDSTRLTNNRFVARAEVVHGKRFTYEESEVSGTRDVAKINCVKHGYFYQRSDQHLLGRGCIECGYESMRESLRK